MTEMMERESEYHIGDSRFRISYGDITKIAADVLVSSDDNYLSMGGGVSMALTVAAGESIRKEARKQVPLGLGEVAVTSAGRLPAKFIFHAVTIDYDTLTYPSKNTVSKATKRCLELADSLGVGSIAFPALGTGVGGFPFQLAAEAMTGVIADHLIGDTRLDLVAITLFAREGITAVQLNEFHERSVALASVSTESVRLGSLLRGVEEILGRLGKSGLKDRVSAIHDELDAAQLALAQNFHKAVDIEDLPERVMADVAIRASELTEAARGAVEWKDTQLEAEVVRTTLHGLLTRLNIHTSHLNKFEIEKAKYGGVGVPPRLGTAIDEAREEIQDLDAKVSELRRQLAELAGAPH